MAENTAVDALYAQFGLTKPGDTVAPPPAAAPSQERFVVTMTSLRAALHAMADDKAFIKQVMQKLKTTQPPARISG